MPSFADILTSFVERFHDEDNSMVTTTTYSFSEGTRKGEAQLKWWKACGMLIIKTIWLTPNGFKPKNRVDASAREVLGIPKLKDLGLKAIVMESVHDELVPKFQALGWKFHEDRSTLTLTE
jgi:hypothetical protein